MVLREFNGLSYMLVPASATTPASAARLSKKRKTITRTFRVDEDIDERLQQLSESMGVSTNLLANRALRKFVEWDDYAEKFGFFTWPSALVVAMMEAIPDEEVSRLGLWAGSNIWKEVIFFWFKEISTENLIDALVALFPKYAKGFDCEYLSDATNGKHVIVIKHGLGRKWSVYYEHMLKGLFGKENKDIEIHAMENQLVVHTQNHRCSYDVK